MNQSPLFLMAQLGAEVSRMTSAKKRGDFSFLASSAERAKHIVEELSLFPEMKERKDEIKNITLSLQDYASITPELSITGEALDAYFMPFSLRMVEQMTQ